MKIWCTDKEKDRMIKILENEEAICVFGNYICLREDCRACLNENIDWHTVKEKLWTKRKKDE
jgi:hypothetical protein